MRIISEEGKSEMLFRKENENGIPSYSIGLSKKKVNGDGFDNGYQPVRFKKGTDIPNKTKIKIKNAFPTFDKYTDKDGKERTSYYIMVLDYELTDNIVTQEEKKSDPFEDFGNEVTLKDDELPF